MVTAASPLVSTQRFARYLRQGILSTVLSREPSASVTIAVCRLMFFSEIAVVKKRGLTAPSNSSKAALFRSDSPLRKIMLFS